MDTLAFLLSAANFPAIILLLMLGFTLLIAVRAQRRPDFDWAGALKDDSGKESALRLAVFVCLAVTTWLMVYFALTVVKTAADLEHMFDWFLTYVLVWSGAKVAEKLIDLLLLRAGARPAQPSP